MLGPWVNRPWLNVLSTAIVSILLMMSLVLMVTTLFTQIDVNELALVLGGVLVVAYAVGGALYARSLRRKPPEPVTADGQAGHLADARPQPAAAARPGPGAG